jgi:diguanylate cyclase (GGDEF)-like protein
MIQPSTAAPAGELGAMVRSRLAGLRPGLGPRLAADLSARGAATLGRHEWRALAESLLDLLTEAVAHGRVDVESGRRDQLISLATGAALGHRQLLDSVLAAETAVIDELARDERAGAVSGAWSGVVNLVRRSSFEVVASITRLAEDRNPGEGVSDPVTSLLLRPVFDAALDREVSRGERRGTSVSVILFALDTLETIAREEGPGVADRVLERMGVLVQRFFRRCDWVARYDRDMLAALLPDTPPGVADDLARRVVEAAEQRLSQPDRTSDTRRALDLRAAVVVADPVGRGLAPRLFLTTGEAALRQLGPGGQRVARIDLATVTGEGRSS